MLLTKRNIIISHTHKFYYSETTTVNIFTYISEFFYDHDITEFYVKHIHNIFLKINVLYSHITEHMSASSF